MSGSIKSKENFWLLSFWRLMSRVNNVQENIISGEIKPRRIKSQGNSCPGGKFWRKTYREEKVWGKDGAKPYHGGNVLCYYRGQRKMLTGINLFNQLPLTKEYLLFL